MRHRRARCSRASRRDRRLGAARHARAGGRLLLQRSTRTPRATRAASTSGTRAEVQALLDRRRVRGTSAAATAWTAEPNFEGHVAPALLRERCEQVAERARPGAARCGRAARRGARKLLAVRAAARPARPRRQAADQLERADDPRPGHRGARLLEPPRLRRRRPRAPGLPARALLARRPAAGHVRTAARACRPTSTTTPSSLTRCSNCCRRAGGASDLAFAARAADALLARFEDAERGGFWFTADDHESCSPLQGLRRRCAAVGQRRRGPRAARGSAG